MKRLVMHQKENPVSLLIHSDEFETIFDVKNITAPSIEILYTIDYEQSSIKIHNFQSLIQANTKVNLKYNEKVNAAQKIRKRGNK